MGFHLVGRTATAFVDCMVKNQSGRQQILHQDEFELLSIKGIVYKARVRPDTLAIKNNDSAVYIFSYSSGGKLSHMEFDNNLRGDTVYFAHASKVGNDTLFKAVSDMVKRNYY